MDGVNKWVSDNPLGAKVLEQQSRIEQLERELAESREREIAFFEANDGLGESCRAAHAQLAAEKELADRLFKAIDSAYVDYAEDEAEFCSALDAYRKARGCDAYNSYRN